MCGRFTLMVDPSEIQEVFPWVIVPQEKIKPRFNIAPTQPVAVVPNDGKNSLDYYTWGLIPSWAKDPSIGNRMINARAESLAEKPSFRSALKRRRCLIIADGFYEWQVVPGSKSKRPVYIYLKDHVPFAFAGLWEQWFAPDGSEVRSCTIITTEPNKIMAPIHNRMPVILQAEAIKPWLAVDEQPAEKVLPLLKPFPSEQMEYHEVSKAVNSPENDVSTLVAAI